MTATTPARYCDYYGFLTYKDFLEREAAGTLADGTISTRKEEGK